MGFIRSCYIRKNTHELRERLKSIGLRFPRGPYQPEQYPALMAMNGIVYKSYLIKPTRFYNTPDCGTNEEVFVAIASIRDDSDKYQWFICMEDGFDLDIEPIKAGEWRYNDEYDKLPRRLRKSWRKANINEIFEHFKEELSDE